MKKYSIIYADPPWRYKVYSEKGLGRSAEKHYPTMELEKIRHCLSHGMQTIIVFCLCGRQFLFCMSAFQL